MYRLLIFSLLLTACQMNQRDGSQNLNSSDQVEAFQKKLELWDQNTKENEVGNSLAYINNEQSTEEVFVYLDEKGFIQKVEEKFYDASTKDLGVRYFYLEKGKKFATREIYNDYAENQGQLVERITFYDQKQKPVHTKFRKADYIEEMELKNFESIKPRDCSMTTANLVLNQKGPFSTTFQGFYQNGAMDYLIVGGPSKDDYTASLLVQFSDKVINFLKKNERRMIGTPLRVDYEKMVDDQNFEYQVLLKAQIISE